MAATVMVVISFPAQQGRHQEREIAKHLLGKVVDAIGDGTSTSGTLKDRGGNSAGSWSYTPGAAS